jgi:hypothetical protein
MARPPKENRKDIRLSARFTDAEADTVNRTAARSGLTVSDLLRFAVLNEPPPPARRRRYAVQAAPELAKLLAAVGHIGGNVNQLAHAANVGSWPESPLLERAVADIQWMRQTLMAALGIVEPAAEARPAP